MLGSATRGLMAVPTKSAAIACGMTLAALLAVPMAPRTTLLEAQQVGTKSSDGDVCPADWARYRLGDGARLCISPQVENLYLEQKKDEYDSEHSYDVASMLKTSYIAQPDNFVVPEAWAHATPEEIGWLVASGAGGYQFRCKVIKFDTSNIEHGNLKTTLRNLPDCSSTEWDKGFAEYKPQGRISLDDFGIHLPPPKTTGKEVCPVKSSRFSCKFIRLCVAADVADHYNLSESKEFQYARCEADSGTVPEANTNSSPHDVGYSAGATAQLIAPRYLKTVELNSSDVLDGNIDDAIKRLVLYPVPTNAFLEYARGYEKGQTEFYAFLEKAKQKKASMNAGNPH